MKYLGLRSLGLQNFLEKFVKPSGPPFYILNVRFLKEIWKRDYRISVETFEETLNTTSLASRCYDTNMQRAVPVKKWFAIFLWRFGTSNSYRSIGKLFEKMTVRKYTVIKIFKQGIASIIPLANNLKKFRKATFETAQSNEAL